MIQFVENIIENCDISRKIKGKMNNITNETPIIVLNIIKIVLNFMILNYTNSLLILQ
jgi:uncharacterized protein with PQ loop repeat